MLYKVLMAGIEVFGELRRYIPERTHVNRGKVIPRTMGRGLIAYDANYMPLAKLPKDLLITKRSNEGVEIVTGRVMLSSRSESSVGV